MNSGRSKARGRKEKLLSGIIQTDEQYVLYKVQWMVDMVLFPWLIKKVITITKGVMEIARSCTLSVKLKGVERRIFYWFYIWLIFYFLLISPWAKHATYLVDQFMTFTLVKQVQHQHFTPIIFMIYICLFNRDVTGTHLHLINHRKTPNTIIWSVKHTDHLMHLHDKEKWKDVYDVKRNQERQKTPLKNVLLLRNVVANIYCFVNAEREGKKTRLSTKGITIISQTLAYSFCCCWF